MVEKKEPSQPAEFKRALLLRKHELGMDSCLKVESVERYGLQETFSLRDRSKRSVILTMENIHPFAVGINNNEERLPL